MLTDAQRGVPKHYRIDGFSVVNLGSSIPIIGLVLIVLEGFIRMLVMRKEIDIVHVQYSLYFALSAHLLNVFTGKPYVVSCRGYDIVYVRKSRFWKNVQRLVFSRAMTVTAVSQQIRRILLDEYGLAESKVKVVPNGIDEREVADALSSASAKDSKSIVYLANLRPVKDPMTAVKAFRLALATVPNLKLTIVGSGPLRGKVESYLRENGLGDSVKLKGNLSHGRALLELAGASFFLMSSVSEGFPNSLLEAMATGNTVIATDVGGVSDLVVDDYNGLLVPPRSPGKLASALARAASDNELAQRLAHEARKTSQSFSWDKIINDYLSIYTTSHPETSK